MPTDHPFLIYLCQSIKAKHLAHNQETRNHKQKGLRPQQPTITPHPVDFFTPPCPVSSPSPLLGSPPSLPTPRHLQAPTTRSPELSCRDIMREHDVNMMRKREENSFFHRAKPKLQPPPFEPADSIPTYLGKAPHQQRPI